MANGQILIGTAGWSYPDWQDVVYPRSGAFDRLRSVADYLDCVEINSSFYRPPTARMARSWLQALDRRQDFLFLAKAWQRFTHQRASPWTRAEFDLFTTGIEPLRSADRLGGLLFQFPWSFRNNIQNREWLRAVAAEFAGWPIVVELRHDSWLTDETLDFFRAHRLTFCNIDQPALAHCIPPTAHVTAQTGYYRLHGRNARNWFRHEQETYGGRYDYLYTEAELDELLQQIKLVAAQARRTFVVLNNHKDAKALANALQLKARLAPGAAVRAPAALREKYPALRACTVADGEQQLPLV